MRIRVVALLICAGLAATAFAESGTEPCTEEKIRKTVRGFLEALGDVSGDEPPEIEFIRNEDGSLFTEIDEGWGEIAIVRSGRQTFTVRVASCSIVRHSDADCRIAHFPILKKEDGKHIQISDEEILDTWVSVKEPDARSTAEAVARYFYTQEEFASMELSRSGLDGLGSSSVEYHYYWIREFEDRGATVAVAYTAVRVDPKSGCVASVSRGEPVHPITEKIIDAKTAKEIAWGYLQTKIFPASQRKCYSTTRYIGLGRRFMPDGNTRWFWNVTFNCDQDAFGGDWGATIHVDAMTGALLDVGPREIKELE